MTREKAIRILRDVAGEFVRESAAIALRYYSDPGEVKFKDDKSPLTAADLEIDDYLVSKLEALFPDILIITEERASTHENILSDEMFFLVDPIDGTKEFINRRDEFTVNVALIEKKRPIAGFVAAPALGHYYFGGDGAGAQEIDIETGRARNIAMSEPDNENLKVIASRSHMSDETKAFIEINKVEALKNAGSSLKFCLLACGEADLYPRFGPTMEWDTAAGHAVLDAAGGVMEFEDGTSFTYAKPEFRNPWFIARSPKAKFRQS